jgi:hypothetical protein
MSSPPPLFVIGCPRSGTTLLTALLHAHPNIAMPPETRFLLPAYRQREEFGDLREPANRRRVGEQITAKGTHFRDLGLDRGEVIEAIVDAPPTLGTALGTVWQEFARSRGKARWGEKRPGYWRDPGVILRLFPNAQIVHLVRDPRSCVASLMRMPWWRASMPSSAALWLMSNRDLGRLGRRLPPDRYHRLRYEDLLADQRQTLQSLCAFLGEDFDEQMIEHGSAARDIVPTRQVWHGLVQGALDSGRIDAWRKDLAPSEVGLVEWVARREMARQGYAPSDAGRRPEPAHVAAALKQIAATRRSQAQMRLADARLRRRFPMPLAAQL